MAVRVCPAKYSVSEGRKPVFGGCFNTIDPRYLDMFASVSGNRKDESFYTVAWMRGQQGRPLLAASGSSGVIRIIDCWRETVVHSFIGHGGAVNEVRVHPCHPALLLSAGRQGDMRRRHTPYVHRQGDMRRLHLRRLYPFPPTHSIHFIGHGGAVNEVRVHPSHPALLLSAGKDERREIGRQKLLPAPSPALHTPFPTCLPHFQSCIGHSVAVNESFIGHGGAVNEVRVHPSHPALLLSAGKDESLRLWNTDTGVCVAIMGGTDGHRNEVLSADFHPGDQAIIASCGMDSSIRVWSLQECWHVVDHSNTWADVPSKFPTKILQYPLYVVCDVHTNYIDCLRWYGDFVLSKSVDNEVILWRWCHKPGTEPGSAHPAEGTLDILQRYPVPDCGFWFIKFDLDYMANIMAIGNCVGKVYVYDLQSSPPILLSTLSRKDCKTQIRQTAVSHDGRIIMSCFFTPSSHSQLPSFLSLSSASFPPSPPPPPRFHLIQPIDATHATAVTTADVSTAGGMKALFSPPRILPPCLSGTKHLEGLSSSLSMPPPPLHVTIPQLWHDMLSGRAERLLSLLNAFFLLVYPDIKHWHFLSSLCASFPSAPPPFSCGTHAIWQGRAPPPISPFVFFLLDILSGRAEKHPSLLNAFFLLVYPDIKHWRFHYAFAFPALALPSPATLASSPLPATQVFSSQLAESIEKESPRCFLRPLPSASLPRLASPQPAPPRLASLAGHLPPCALPAAAARSNKPALLSHLMPFYHPPPTLLAPPLPLPLSGHLSSRALPAAAPRSHQPAPLAAAAPPATCPSATGWELNAKGRTGARCADLAPLMDPARLVDEAASLNLKLMRWRVLPQLQLEGLNATKCLLLGAGTLGCQVARSLLSKFDEVVCAAATAAAGAIKCNQVFAVRSWHSWVSSGTLPAGESVCLCVGLCAPPTIASPFPCQHTSGHRLAIPMPGHPVSPSEAPRVQADVAALLALIRQSDAVFLLTDTRESRWLPTLLCAAEGKVAINAALGFDSFLVMRHGAPPLPVHATSAPTASDPPPIVRCCPSLPAPRIPVPSFLLSPVPIYHHSTAHRTLGQQCTVTRPGLAVIAGALAAFPWVPRLIAPLHQQCTVTRPWPGGHSGGFGGLASTAHRTLAQQCTVARPGLAAIAEALDSTAHRTLDQQCTVTRPGLAAIAGALAVELLVAGGQSGVDGAVYRAVGGAAAPPTREQVVIWLAATAGAVAVEQLVGLLHHPLGYGLAERVRILWLLELGIAAPAEDTSADGVSASASSHLCSPLGPLPHQLRGFLSFFSQLPITGFAFHQCTACSHTVVSAYRERGFAFLMGAFNDPTYLERITGLDKLHAATVEIEVDWDDSEDDNSEDFGELVSE
ncbi:unnamed protein product [Closterium sp. NIES-64]|nr:unnamed protein product [Closterium sp. NIES-64]